MNIRLGKLFGFYIRMHNDGYFQLNSVFGPYSSRYADYDDIINVWRTTPLRLKYLITLIKKRKPIIEVKWIKRNGVD